MSDLVEGCAADACEGLFCVRTAACEAAGGCLEPSPNLNEVVAAIVGRVLAEMRKPGKEVEEALRTHSPDLHSPEEIMQAVVDAFAREHGLADG